MMDMQPRQQTATGGSRNPEYGISRQSYAEGNSAIGSDQRDMWRMGKAQELRVRSWWFDVLLKARLTASSDISVLGRQLVSHQSWGVRGNT